ncbi:hypothetical protein SAMN05216505_11267 [Streptomyces prasinopilosus]|uniref:Uncharacterized protein n=1 Tax=Streptomyces prasinopilosus TaxID=67344 RepID=A0A1G6XVD3_9ACTN|nr:hypothetical protein SAMN05216505_11267 [Streptomyces prasinopilosus]
MRLPATFPGNGPGPGHVAAALPDGDWNAWSSESEILFRWPAGRSRISSAVFVHT